MTQQPDYYAILGVTPRASRDEIIKSYRAQVQRYHPDRHQGNDLRGLAEERLAQLNQAFEVLGDPNRRAAYDAVRRGAGPIPPWRTSAGPLGRAAPPWWLRPVIAILIIALFGLLMRYLRNPRILLYAAIGTAIVWIIALVVRGRRPDPRR